mgnify:CR=1 FL=1
MVGNVREVSVFDVNRSESPDAQLLRNVSPSTNALTVICLIVSVIVCSGKPIFSTNQII